MIVEKKKNLFNSLHTYAGHDTRW